MYKKQTIKYFLIMLFVAMMFHLRISASEIFYVQNQNVENTIETFDINDNKSIIGREYEIGTVINSDEKMKWVVVDYDKNDSSKVLLVTNGIVDYREYHNGPTNYKNSKIRYYLNKEFYEKNFSVDERKHIIVSNIPVKLSKDNLEYSEGTPSQIMVNDKIFLLSREEVLKYELIKNGNTTRNSYAELIAPDKKEYKYWLRDIMYYSEPTVFDKGTFISQNVNMHLGSHLGVVVGMWYDFSVTKSNEDFDKEESEYCARLLFERKGGKLKKVIYTDEEKSNIVRFNSVRANMNYKPVFFGTYQSSNDVDMRLSWYVVDDDGKNLTLFLQNILEYMELEYDTYDKSVLKDNPYERSNLKKYMNESLYEKIFSEEEKDLIVPSDDEKMRLPDINDIFNYELLNFDHTTGKRSDVKNKDFFWIGNKYSFFVNVPYEHNDNVYLMSLCDKSGTSSLSFNYSYNKDNVVDVITASGIRPIVKVDKTKFKEYLKKQSLKLELGDLNKRSLANKKLKFNQKIKFGKYEQDGDLKNGKEDIEWRIVKKYEDKYLLLSDKVIDVIDLTNDIKIEYFEDSYAHNFANTIFIDEAFSDVEKSKLELVDNSYIIYYDEVLKKYEEEGNPGKSFGKACEGKVFNISTHFDLFMKNLMYEDIYKTENTKYVDEKCSGLDCYLLEDLAAYKTYNDMPFYVHMKNDGNIDFEKKVISGFRPLICISSENLVK